MVSSSRVAVRTPVGVSSARTRISDTVDSYRWSGARAGTVVAADEGVVRRWADADRLAIRGFRGRRGSQRAGPHRCRRRRRPCRPARAGAGETSTTLVAAAARPTERRVDPDVREREGLDGLLLGQHDRPEGGVARLVGLVGDRHDRRQRGAHLLGRGGALSGDRDRARHPTDSAPAKVAWLTSRRSATIDGHDGHLAVGRRHPARTRSNPTCSRALARTSEVARASEPWIGVVQDVNALVAADREGLEQPVLGGLGADGEVGDRRRRDLPRRGARPARPRTRRARRAAPRRRLGRGCGRAANDQTAVGSGTCFTRTTIFIGDVPFASSAGRLSALRGSALGSTLPAKAVNARPQTGRRRVSFATKFRTGE